MSASSTCAGSRCSASNASAADAAVRTDARWLRRYSATIARLCSSSSTTSTSTPSSDPSETGAGAATFAAALHLHPSAVRFGEMLHDRQSEPESAVLARRRAVGLTERLEDVRQELARDPATGVGDRDLDALRRATHAHVNRALIRRELH